MRLGCQDGILVTIMPDSPTGNNLTEQQLKFGYWFVTHKVALRKGGVIALILVNAALWLPAVYMAFRLFVVDGPAYARMLQQMSVSLVNPDVIEAARPEPPVVAQTLVFNTAGNRYDFAAIIKNQNPKWYGDFEYRFVAEGFATPARHAVLLPGRETVVSELGVTAPSRIRGGRLEFSSFLWRRISTRVVKDPPSFVAERTAIVVSDARHEPGPPARTSFVVTNNTAFGYWNVDVIVLLKRGTSVVGVNRVTLERLASGEARPVDVAWFDSVGSVGAVDVRPQVNIFDPGVYMPARG